MTTQSHSFLTDADRRVADGLNKPRATVRAIAKEVCELTGHSLVAVMGPSRLAADCRARELVCYIAHRSGMSTSQIGQALRRDHSSIVNAIQNEKRRRGELA